MDQLRNYSSIMNYLRFNEIYNLIIEKYEMNSSKPNEVKIEAVKNLMKGLERPFSLNELVPQVKDITKKEFEDIFILLLEKGEIIMKMNGKAKIYFFNYKQNIVSHF